MRRNWIGTGWKMNHLLKEAELYSVHLNKFVVEEKPESTIFLVPPFTALSIVARELQGSNVKIGAQNMHWEEKGAFTGEISPLMIKDCGATLVEIGHSERRAFFGETDKTVNAKVLSALRNGLQPLICVGETAEERDNGVAHNTLERQVKIALHGAPQGQANQIIFAYEPVWAIGHGGITAEPEYANQAIHFIRVAVSSVLGSDLANEIPILYGGSVNLENATAMFLKPQIDGLFIGRSAWEVGSFIELISLVEKARLVKSKQLQSEPTEKQVTNTH